MTGNLQKLNCLADI